MHGAYNNMLMAEANERTKECCLLLLLLLLRFWLNMNFEMSKPFKFPIHQTKKIQFYLINFTILIRIFIESPTLLCEIDTFFWSCCCGCCWFLVFESFIRFAFMSPDVWFRLRSVEFSNWKSLKLSVFSLSVEIGDWNVDGTYSNSILIHCIFWPTRTDSYNFVYGRREKKKHRRESDDRIFVDCRKTNHQWIIISAPIHACLDRIKLACALN